VRSQTNPDGRGGGDMAREGGREIIERYIEAILPSTLTPWPLCSMRNSLKTGHSPENGFGDELILGR
jgi:hypothetical protein